MLEMTHRVGCLRSSGYEAADASQTNGLASVLKRGFRLRSLAGSGRCSSGSPVRRIHLSPPDVTDLERELLLDAFDSNWIAPLGPHVDAFEREFAEFLGTGDAAALSSGTAAL